MSLLYDIKLNNGEILKDCYFVAYDKAVKSGRGLILAYMPSHDKCFDKFDNEITDKDLSSFDIICIHDEEGNDYTEALLHRHTQVNHFSGYPRPFPIYRRSERVQ